MTTTVSVVTGLYAYDILSNANRVFYIIMPHNAIRAVIRLNGKYLHDTFVSWAVRTRSEP